MHNEYRIVCKSPRENLVVESNFIELEATLDRIRRFSKGRLLYNKDSIIVEITVEKKNA